MTDMQRRVLQERLERCATELEQRLAQLDRMYGDMGPLMMDTNGRYLMLDAWAALGQVLAAQAQLSTTA